MERLAGKTAIVTGGGGGIGSVTAERLASEGAAVVVADIDEASGMAVAERITAAGGESIFVRLDVTDAQSFRDLAETAVTKYGCISILHNNAAGTHLYAKDQDVQTMDPDAWDEIMAMNSRSVLLGMQAVLPHMREQGVGSVVNMSSTRAALGAMDLAAYGASKAAVDALTRYAAVQYGRDGIRCNSIRPGFIETPQSRALHADGNGASRLMRHVAATAPGTPADIASLVVFLGSDESRYITGQTIRIDGGMLSQQPFVAQDDWQPAGL